MNRNTIVALAAAVLLAVVGTAGAQSLKMRQFQTDQETHLAAALASANQRCQSQMAAKIDWTTFTQDEAGSASPSGYCDDALTALASLCGDQLAKEAIQKAVKNLMCTKGAPRAVSLKDGTLTYTIEYGSANNEDFVKEFLRNHL